MLRTLYINSTTGLDHEQGESESYLAWLMMCDELYNLIRMQSLFDGLQKAHEESDRHQQMIPLHMEAALFLLEERLHVAQDLPEAPIPLVHWKTFIKDLLLKHTSTTLPPLQNAQLCSMFLKATELYRHNGRDVLGHEQEEQLDTVINTPFSTIEPKNLWEAFLKDVGEFLRLLAYREQATANNLLTAKLGQEWYALPEHIKTRLRERSASFPRNWLEEMSQKNSLLELLSCVQVLREQSALIVGGLSRLAITHVRVNIQEGEVSASLIKIGKAVLRLRLTAGDKSPSIEMDLLSQSPNPSALSAASTLLGDEGYLEKLCQALEEGTKKGGKIGGAAQTLGGEIQGLALGAHGKLHGVLNLAKDVNTVRMKGT